MRFALLDQFCGPSRSVLWSLLAEYFIAQGHGMCEEFGGPHIPLYRPAKPAVFPPACLMIITIHHTNLNHKDKSHWKVVTFSRRGHNLA